MEFSDISFWVCALFLGYALQRICAVSLKGVCAIILGCPLMGSRTNNGQGASRPFGWTSARRPQEWRRRRRRSCARDPATNNIVFTDPGNEIDDELLLWKLLTTQSNSVWYIVCVPYSASVPNATRQQLNSSIKMRIERVRKLFGNEFGDKNEFTNDNGATFILGGPEIIPSGPIDINFLVQIAPLCHISPEKFVNMSIRYRIVQGDLDNPENSINLTKGIPADRPELITEYLDQQEVFDAISEHTTPITTEFARNVPLTYTFMTNVPEVMRKCLLDKAFEQFVGRVNPALKWAENISVVNHKTIMAMLPDDVRIAISSGTIPNMESQYVDDIRAKVRSFLKDVKDPSPDYVMRLEHIAMAVLYITKTFYVGDKFTLDDLFDPKNAYIEWCEYIERHRCNLTPAYDVLAWVVIEKGYLPTRDECIDILNAG